MKIRRNLRREDLELLVKFLEKVLNDEELSMLAGLIVGGILAREFENAGLKIFKKKKVKK